MMLWLRAYRRRLHVGLQAPALVQALVFIPKAVVRRTWALGLPNTADRIIDQVCVQMLALQGSLHLVRLLSTFSGNKQSALGSPSIRTCLGLQHAT